MEQGKSTKKSNGRFWAVALLLGGLVLFIVSGYPLIKQIALDSFGLEVTGTVVGVSGGDRIKAPIVRFITLDGREIEFKSGLATNFISFSKGEDVKIRYLAVMPQIAEVTALGRISYFTDIGATCLGVFLLMGGWISLRNKPFVLDFSRNKA